MLTNISEGMYFGVSEMLEGVAGIVSISEADFALIPHHLKKKS